MARKLTHDELVSIVNNVLRPKGKGFTSEQIDQQLLLFCINCPDPAGAMDIIIESAAPVTAEELVAWALACPARDPRTLLESELPFSHPLRHMKLER